MTRWGIDLGGTKIEGVVIAGDTEICRTRIPTEADRGYDHIVHRIAELVTILEQQSAQTRPESIGIGTPGAVEPATGLMKNCNTTALNGKPLPDDLERALGCRVKVANDANCFALAEATLGAARGADVVFGVILGTGVGGGVVVHGQVLYGAQGIAGEWGHNVLDPDGEPCYCGKVGCVETVLSGPALERYYSRLTGERRALKEISESTGEEARLTIDHLVREFGRAAATVINILDPDVVVLGGGVGNVAALRTGAAQALEPWVFNREVRTRIVSPILGDNAGVIGAAML
jgi:predicted NBD/HSP70 family sugar kinase